MPGRRQKHPDALVNQWGGRHKPLTAVAVANRPIPPSPTNLHPKAEEAWLVLWSSSLGGAFKETDVFGIERYFYYVSEWWKASELPGQARFLVKIEKVMRELEKSYGLDPLSRLRLGLTLVDEQKAVQGLKSSVKPKEIAQ